MFSGMTFNSIDAKGRIILPTKFREQLGESFFVTKGFTDCVQILSTEQFEHLRQQIKELPANKALALQYIMIAPAVEVTPNAQGRIPLPQSLRDDAGLEKEAVVIGMDTRIEVWDKSKYDQFIEKQKQEVLADALELLKL